MNVCLCCKTSHDSTACPQPSGEGLGSSFCSGLLDPFIAPKDGTVILAHFGWPYLIPTFWCRQLEEWVTAQPGACAHGEMQLFESDTEPHDSMVGWALIPNLPENLGALGFIPSRELL